MTNLATTISNLHNEKPIESKRVGVLLCIPLTRERYEKETRKPNFLIKLFAREKEFAHEQLEVWNWQQYEEGTVLPVFKNLLDIRENSSASVIPDVTFGDFKKIFRTRAFDVLFLVAHHIIPESQTKIDSYNLNSKIEFANGGYSLAEIHDFLASLDGDHKISLIYMICESEDLKEVSYNKSNVVKSVASAFWKIPLVEGIAFVKCWIEFLSGENTLSEAYDLAIELYIR